MFDDNISNDISALTDEGSSSTLRLAEEGSTTAMRPRSARLGRGSVVLRKMTINKLQFEEGVMYGRDTEIEQLKSIFERCSTSREFVMIEGDAGAGKSALGESLRKNTFYRSGFFLPGKFDQQQIDDPYSGISSACRVLCSDLFEYAERTTANNRSRSKSTSSMEYEDSSCTSEAKDSMRSSAIQRKRWHFSFDELQQTLRGELGKDSQVLTSVIPTLNQIIGDEQIGVDESSGYNEAKTRLIFAFRRFIRVLCSFGRVCLCLDDVQWADLASLDLLEALVTDTGNKNLTIITCYRRNEIGDEHPFSKLVEGLKIVKNKSQFNMTKISVDNLHVGHVNDIVSNAMNTDPAKTMALAELTFKKTQGNAFHVIQYLQSLVDRELLTFVMGVNTWKFDINEIAASSKPTENVVDLITTRMNSLPYGVRCLLPMIACLGATFSHEVAGLIAEHFGAKLLSAKPADIYHISDFLEVCLLEGLIVKTSVNSYQWEHDRYQEAALLFVSEHELNHVQFSVGKLLVEQLSEDGLNDMLFVLIILLGKEDLLVDNFAMRLKVARLSLRAGNSAIQSAAFHSASTALSKGIGLLPQDKWDKDSDLCLDLYSQGAVAAYCQGNFDLMQKHADEVISREDRSLLDKRRVYNILLLALQARGHFEETRKLSTKLLAKLECKFPPKIAWLPRIILGLMKTKKSVDKALTIFPKLNNLEDESKIWTMQLLENLTTTLYALKSNLMVLVVLRGYKYTMEYGISRYSPPILSLVSLLLANTANDYEGARKIAAQAISMSENHRSTQARTLFLATWFTLHHQIPVESCQENMLRVYRVGIATGDTKSGAFGIMSYLSLVLYTGGFLGKLVRDYNVYCDQLHGLGQYKTEFTTRMMGQVVADLVSDDYDNSALDGSCFIKQDFDEYLERTNDEHGLSQYYRSFIHSAFWQSDYKTVVWITEKANFHRGSSEKHDPGPYANIPLCFQIVLACQVLARQTGKRKYAAIARQICKNKISVYARSGNPNTLHYELLVKAEIQVGKGNLLAAKGLYDSAILFSQRRGFINHLALAHELKAKAVLDSGDVDDATYHMGRAVQFYKEWGAAAKVVQLTDSFPTLLAPPDSVQLGDSFSTLFLSTDTMNMQ